jgi:uncharacterized protein (DUF3084 family)
MNTNLPGLANRNRAQSDAFNGLAVRARELRERADALISLESELKNNAANLDRREANIARAENALREHERRLAALEAEMSVKEGALTKAVIRERFNDTLAMVAALDGEPVVANSAALAASIIRAGQIRRGEIDPAPPIPKGVAGQIVLAGMRRRGEIL